MKANEKTIKPTVLESIPIQMAQNMKVIERMKEEYNELLPLYFLTFA